MLDSSPYDENFVESTLNTRPVDPEGRICVNCRRPFGPMQSRRFVTENRYPRYAHMDGECPSQSLPTERS